MCGAGAGVTFNEPRVEVKTYIGLWVDDVDNCDQRAVARSSCRALLKCASGIVAGEAAPMVEQLKGLCVVAGHPCDDWCGALLCQVESRDDILFRHYAGQIPAFVAAFSDTQDAPGWWWLGRTCDINQPGEQRSRATRARVRGSGEDSGEDGTNRASLGPFPFDLLKPVSGRGPIRTYHEPLLPKGATWPGSWHEARALYLEEGSYAMFLPKGDVPSPICIWVAQRWGQRGDPSSVLPEAAHMKLHRAGLLGGGRSGSGDSDIDARMAEATAAAPAPRNRRRCAQARVPSGGPRLERHCPGSGAYIRSSKWVCGSADSSTTHNTLVFAVLHRNCRFEALYLPSQAAQVAFLPKWTKTLTWQANQAHALVRPLRRSARLRAQQPAQRRLARHRHGCASG